MFRFRDIISSHDMISPVDHQALAEFRYQIRHFLAFSEREARVTGIEPRQPWSGKGARAEGLQ